MEWSRKQQLNTQRVKTKNPRKKTTKTATITRNPNRMEMQEEQTQNKIKENRLQVCIIVFL